AHTKRGIRAVPEAAANAHAYATKIARRHAIIVRVVNTRAIHGWVLIIGIAVGIVIIVIACARNRIAEPVDTCSILIVVIIILAIGRILVIWIGAVFGSLSRYCSFLLSLLIGRLLRTGFSCQLLLRLYF